MLRQLNGASAIVFRVQKEISGHFIFKMNAENPLDVFIVDEKEAEYFRQHGNFEDLSNLSDKVLNIAMLEKAIYAFSNPKYIVIANSGSSAINFDMNIDEIPNNYVASGVTGISGVFTPSSFATTTTRSTPR